MDKPTQPLNTAAIEARLEVENRELRQLADDAIDLATDMLGYVPDYFRLKHKHDEALEGLRARLHPTTPTKENDQ